MKAGVIDDRMFDLIACHEAAHVLRAWDAGYAVAVVELDAHRGNVLLEEEPWDNPAASWAISKAGREACGQLFDRWDTESVEDKLYSGAPGGLHQLRQWQSALNAWMDLRCADIIHLGMELTTRTRWHRQRLADLVWRDDCFRDFRHLYERPELKSQPLPQRPAGMPALSDLIGEFVSSLRGEGNLKRVTVGGAFR